MVRWQTQRRVQMLAERAEGLPLIRPRISNIEDIRPVALVQRPRLRAYEQMKFLVRLKPLGHLGNDPGPEPVCAGWVVRVVGQEIYRYSHGYLPALRGYRSGTAPLVDRAFRGHDRSEDVRGDRFGGHARLTYKLRERMHDSLMQVLDNAVIRSFDMNGHIS